MVLREMLTQRFLKTFRTLWKTKMGSTVFSPYETAGDMAPPGYHSATKHISTIDWWFSPPIKMHLQSSSSWKNFSLKWSLTVINIQGLYHTGTAPKRSRRNVQLIFGSEFLDINSLFRQGSLVSRNKSLDQVELSDTLDSRADEHENKFYFSLSPSFLQMN